MRVYIYPLTK